MKIDGRRNTKTRIRLPLTRRTKTSKEDKKGLEEEICVVTCNVNKSSAQYAFLRGMAQCQANVVMFQETENWQEDGMAEELGWALLKEGKTAIADKK